MSGCDRELNAHFYSAATLKYHVPDTWHDTTPSHIILTLGRPVIALPRKSECQARSSLYHFLQLWYVAARDRTRDLPFPGADTLPIELSGPVVVQVTKEFWSNDEFGISVPSFSVCNHWSPYWRRRGGYTPFETPNLYLYSVLLREISGREYERITNTLFMNLSYMSCVRITDVENLC